MPEPCNFPEQDFRGVRGCTSTSRALYGQVAMPVRLPDGGHLPGTNPDVPVWIYPKSRSLTGTL